ncbi:DUF418 domain-containing protein [Geomicrobium sp. JCM 19055]|uniref:DUF418 domain-containing protein n=1 Tax=Geomicrobium sp. JCM 19055 TaxID=1460649 RepID=UPI002235F62A|nr:hypothetical protein [Geomicrobium sp. JCM 19055]
MTKQLNPVVLSTILKNKSFAESLLFKGSDVRMSGPEDPKSTVKQPPPPQHSLQGSTNGRLLAPDLARGFMLLIIAIAHATLWVVATETTQIGRPLGGTIVDDVTNFFSTLFVANRGLPLFALLFGYGLAMMVRRQTENGMLEKKSKQLITRRALFLILFGIIHAVFIGGIDILFVYGISTFLIGWILFKKDKVLTYALVCMSLFFCDRFAYYMGDILCDYRYH